MPQAPKSQENENPFRSVNIIFSGYLQNIEQKKGSGWKPYLRWKAFWQDRIKNDGDFPGIIDLYNDLQNGKATGDKTQLGSEWKELGPQNVPLNLLNYQSSGIGRMNCIRVHPYTKNILYAGSASGGLWKSTDGGESWAVKSGTQFMSLGITDIAISPSNPNTIYAATGDANGLHMTRGYSIGIIKSTDGGENWMLAGESSELSERLITGRLLVHPENENIVVAASYKGILKTTDGGKNWKVKKQGFFFRDMEYKPGDFNVLYVSTFNMDGNTYIFKSEDMGETWILSQSFNNVNRIALAVGKAKPSRVYALCSRSGDSGFGGFYVSDNEGSQWTKKSGDPNILGIDAEGKEPGGQGYYDLAIAVSPENSDVIIAAGIHLWQSTNGGRNWSIMNHWAGAGNIPYMHADQHDVVFGNDLTIYSANDGGIYISADTGKTWEDISNGIAVMQVYRIGGFAGDNYPVFCGVQDNGTNYFDGKNWFHPLGADGTECMVDFSDRSKVFTSIFNGDLYFSQDSGKSFTKMVSGSQFGENGAWITPFVMNPRNSSSIFAGYNNVWKSYNSGKDWERQSSFGIDGQIGTLAIAPSDTNKIYAAFGGQLFETETNNSGWKISGIYPEAITYIAVDAYDPGHYYISFSGYNKDYKVIEVIHGTSVNISGGLPNVPVNCIVYQNGSPHRVFAGTDIGVYYRDAVSDGWQKLEGGLPPVVVNELEINYKTGKLFAGTFGRGLWEYQLPKCNMEKPEMNINEDMILCLGETRILKSKGDYDNIIWQDGSNAKEFIVRDSGFYYITVGDGNGCYNSSNIIKVSIEVDPSAKIQYWYDKPLCEGDSVKLAIDEGFAGYKWSNGENGREIYAIHDGNYFATLNTGNGCYYQSDTIELKFLPAPAKPEIVRYSNTLVSTSAESYAWYLDGSLIEGALGQELKVTKTGRYNVQVFNSDSCSAISDDFIVTTGVQWNKNVTHDFEDLLKHPADYGIDRILVSDCIGRVVIDTTANYGIRIDNGVLTSGVYYVRLFGKSNVYTVKIVVY